MCECVCVCVCVSVCVCTYVCDDRVYNIIIIMVTSVERC